jgi:hypothetical protein
VRKPRSTSNASIGFAVLSAAITDIALHEKSFTGSGVISALFARPFGLPESAVTLAKYPDVLQLGAGLFSFGKSDQIHDLGVLAKTDSGTLAAAIFLEQRPASSLLRRTPNGSDDISAVARGNPVAGCRLALIWPCSAANDSDATVGLPLSPARLCCCRLPATQRLIDPRDRGDATGDDSVVRHVDGRARSPS